jgi:uncharacterized surface protein with fasciclin (FAS1) repeats
LREAGWAEALKGEGPFAVFASTDDAFSALPEGTIEALVAVIPAAKPHFSSSSGSCCPPNWNAHETVLSFGIESL